MVSGEEDSGRAWGGGQSQSLLVPGEVVGFSEVTGMHRLRGKRICRG